MMNWLLGADNRVAPDPECAKPATPLEVVGGGAQERDRETNEQERANLLRKLGTLLASNTLLQIFYCTLVLCLQPLATITICIYLCICSHWKLLTMLAAVEDDYCILVCKGTSFGILKLWNKFDDSHAHTLAPLDDLDVL
jgi:hypothetical protein